MTSLTKNIKKIAIFRALQLGDLLCAVPAFRALRQAFPDAEITLIGLPWAAGFVKRFHEYIDRFIYFPGYKGLPEQSYSNEAYELFLQRIKPEAFDLVIQMQGNGTIVNPLVQQFGARYVAGFHNQESLVPSDLFMEYPDHGPEIQRHLSLMRHLGIPDAGEQLEFPLTHEDYKELDELLLPVSRNRYVCIHPGSRGKWRQWPPSYFAMLADYFNENGYMAVITGTENERDITREVRKCLRQPAIDLTGATSLGSLAALVKESFLVISNCTGVAHVAAAVQTPGLIISMDGEPERWGHDIHTVIDWTQQPHLENVILQAEALLKKQKAASELQPVKL